MQDSCYLAIGFRYRYLAIDIRVASEANVSPSFDKLEIPPFSISFDGRCTAYESRTGTAAV